MSTPLAQHPAAASLASLAQALHRAAAALDAWLLARRKGTADDVALTAMSDRELRDIGLDPGYVKGSGQDDWVRDWS